MRSTTHLLLALLALPFLTTAKAPAKAPAKSLPKKAAAAAPPTIDPRTRTRRNTGPVVEATTFNGQTVPPTPHLPGKQLNATIAEGNWFIEFFSPYCAHCRRFAPTWQTLYEYYYTQNVPLPPAGSKAAKDPNYPKTFTEYYDFHFAKVDCVANGDTCLDHNIDRFPTLVLYVDGERKEGKVGAGDLKYETDWIEVELEELRPGTRPIEALKLPKVGAREAAPVDVTTPMMYDEDDEDEKGEGEGENDYGDDYDDDGMGVPGRLVGDSRGEARGGSLGDPLGVAPGGVLEDPRGGAPGGVLGDPRGSPSGAVRGDVLGDVRGAAREVSTKPTTSTSTTTSSGSATGPPKLPVRVPNSQGRSLTLTAENFQRVVTMTQDPWFVKFYTPRCAHCQALAPNWRGMAKQMQNQLNVGEVNCEKEKRLCKDVEVRAYPTIMFFRDNERIEYDGLRGLGDLLSFANKALAVGEGVRDISAAEFEEMEKKEEVIFLYLYDHATTSEDFKALERMVMSLIGHAKLVKSNDPVLNERFKIRTWPRLLVSRDGKPTYYNVLSPDDMRDYRKVLGWMKSVWLPIVPELTAANAREIMDKRLVVLGILSREREDDFVSAKREIKNAALEWIDKRQQAFQLERQELRDAKQLRIEEAEDRNDQRALRSAKLIKINMDALEHKEVGFAWVDGVFWERWIRTTYGINVAEGEKVVINDEDNKRYWDVAATGNPITPSRTSILETLRHVVVSPPRIAPKSTTTALGHVYWVLRGQVIEHPLVSAGFALLTVIVLAVWGRRFLLRASAEKGGYFRIGEKGGPMDGLLGGNGANGQGKTD